MKTKRFFALALTVIMMFSLLPHAFAAEDITAMLAEYQKQAQAMQQEVIAQQETARQNLALAQQQATQQVQQQVQQAQADMQKAYKLATCNHDRKRTYTEDKDETDGVHDEVTVCIDCEKELKRVTVEDEKEQTATLRTALKAAPALRAGGEITTADELQAALNAGGTVMLTKNIEYNSIIPITVNTTTVTLKLEKGVSFEFKGAGGIDVRSGNLTLTGSGTISILRVYGGGSAAVSGGTVEHLTVHGGGSAEVVSSGTVGRLYVDGGSATISGGTVEKLDVDSGSAEVSGGTVTYLLVDSGSAEVVSGGTVDDLDVNSGSATIYGGTVDNLNVNGGSATIYGGTIHHLGGDGTIVFGVTATPNPAEGGSVKFTPAVANTETEYSVTADPATGYEFVQWSSNANVTFTNQSAAETKFTIKSAPSAPVTVTATFKPTLTIRAKDQEYTYNGQTQGEGDTVYADPAEIAEKVTVEGLLEGDELTSIVLDGQGDKDAGKYVLVPSGARVNGNSGSDKYKITYYNGTLTISTRPVTFTGKSETKKYTGNPITIDTLEVTETTKDAGLLSGHTHNVTFSATGTEPGGHTGTITEKGDVVILDSNNNIVTKNYEIKVVNGKLTIEQDVFTITCETSEHGKVEASKDSAAEKETITLVVSPGEGYELESLTVKDASGNPVSVTNNEFTMPAANVTVTATFKLKTFTIKFVNDDNAELQSSAVAYGETPAYTGETPEKPADEANTYTFAGWEPAVTSVTGEATYKATYTATPKAEFTIIWLNGDGTELDRKTYKEGVAEPATDKTPVKTATAQYTYSFNRWDEGKTVGNVKTYTPLFTETKNSYTVKFVNDDGTELQSSAVAYGETPAYTGETPEKPADEANTYTFAGWEPAITSVTGEATYKATYTATKNEYTFTYEWAKDNSTVTAVRTCSNNPALNLSETVKTTSEGTAATCEATGKVTYTAEFTNAAFEKQTKTVETPALGHKWKVSEELWAGDYSSVTVTFVCENDATHTKKEAAASAESISGSVATYTAAITLDGQEFTFSKAVDISGQGYVFTHTTQIWVKGSTEGATFRVTRLGDDRWTYKLFTGIRVDGAPVSAYSKAPGSIILTLHPAYLESLSVGYHTLAVYFTDGEATADFLILPAGGSYDNNSTGERYTYVPPSNNPRTGDDSNLALWGALAIVSAAGIALLIVGKRKKT